ncbi:hypothetical protein [Candidatus Cardinium hertigii]|nr:hypothetical protein [Candidatus Cardinium hertigii]
MQDTNIDLSNLNPMERSRVNKFQTELEITKEKFRVLTITIENTSSEIDVIKNDIKKFADNKNLEINDWNNFEGWDDFNAINTKYLVNNNMSKLLLTSMMYSHMLAENIKNKAKDRLDKANNALMMAINTDLDDNSIINGEKHLANFDQLDRQIEEYKVSIEYVIELIQHLIKSINEYDSSGAESTASSLLSPNDNWEKIDLRLKKTRKITDKILNQLKVDNIQQDIKKICNPKEECKEYNILTLMPKNMSFKIIYVADVLLNYVDTIKGLQEYLNELNMQVKNFSTSTEDVNQDKRNLYNANLKYLDSLIKEIGAIINLYREAYYRHLTFAYIFAKKLNNNWEKYMNTNEECNSDNLLILFNKFYEESQAADEKIKEASKKERQAYEKLTCFKVHYDTLQHMNNIEQYLSIANKNSSTAKAQYDEFTAKDPRPRFDAFTILLHNFSKTIRHLKSMTNSIYTIIAEISNTVFKLHNNDYEMLNNMLSNIEKEEKSFNKEYEELEQSICYIDRQKNLFSNCKNLQKVMEISGNIKELFNKITYGLNQLKQKIVPNDNDIDSLKVIKASKSLAIAISKFAEQNAECASYAAKFDFKESTGTICTCCVG